MTERSEYVIAYEAELAARRSEADELRAVARNGHETQRARYESLLDVLKTKEQLAESRIANIRERKDEDWAELRDSAERAREELDAALLAAKRGVQGRL